MAVRTLPRHRIHGFRIRGVHTLCPRLRSQTEELVPQNCRLIGPLKSFQCQLPKCGLATMLRATIGNLEVFKV